MSQLTFDATNHETLGTYEALPAGWYNAAIDASEMKATKDGTGAYLQLSFKILDGFANGRKVFARLNLQNSNPTAQEIAYKTLSSIMHATGQLRINDSAELHAIPMKIKLKVRAGDDKYEASNDITAYDNVNSNHEMAQAPVAQNAPATGSWNAAPQPPQPPQGMAWGNAPQPQPQTAPQAQTGGFSAPAQPWGQPQQQAAPQMPPQPQPQTQAPNPFAQQQTPPQAQPQMEAQAQQQQQSQPSWATADVEAAQQQEQEAKTQQQGDYKAPVDDPATAQAAAQAQSSVPPWAKQ